MKRGSIGEAISATTSLDHPIHIESTSGIQFRWLVAIAPSFTFAICYLREFVLPHAPVMSWADQMLFATNGARIVAGQMPYRDYFQFVTPALTWPTPSCSAISGCCCESQTC